MKNVMNVRHLFRKHFMWLFLLTAFVFGSNFADAQTTVTIGTGTSTGRYPFNDYFVHSRSQCLYLSSEIGIGGTITKLRWYRNDASADTDAIGTTEIWLMETSNTTLSGTTWEGPGTLVATITDIDLGSSAGWYEIDITDFEYNGTDNLLVSVRTQDAPYTSPHSYWRYTSTSSNYRARLGNDDSTNPPTMSLSYSRPNIQFDIVQPPCTGTPDPGNTIASANPVCVGNNISLSLQNQTAGSGVTYQWQSSPDDATWTNIGAGLSTLTISDGDTYYQCIVTCTNTSETATSNSLLVNTSVSSIPYIEEFITTSTPTCWTTTGWTIGSIRGVTGNPGNNIYKNLHSSATTATFTTGLMGSITASTELSFDYITADYYSPYGAPAAGTGDFVVSISTDGGNTYTELETVSNDGITGWKNKSYSLTTYAGENAMFKFVGNWVSDDYDLAFDNITVGEPPACEKPTALTATNITTTSADLGWTANGTTTWNLKVTTSATFDPTTDTGVPFDGSTTDNPHSLSGLDAATTYYWYVQTDCGVDGLSDWSNVGMFTTSDVFYALPISENFESGLGNVTFVNGSQTNYWTHGTLASQTGNAMFVTNNGTDNLYTTGSSTSVAHAYIPVDFNGATDVVLNFDWICKGETTTYDKMRVYLIPDTESINAGTLPSSGQIGETNYNGASTLQNESITLSSTEITQDQMKLVFTWSNDNGGGTQPPASVDNITLEEITCVAPTALTATNITYVSATISWTAPAGTPDGYQYEVRTSGDAGSGPTGRVAEGTTTHPTVSAIITGLDGATTYTYYVRTDCDGTNFSTWASNTFNTLSCNMPTGVYSSNVATTTATITWFAPATGTPVGYEYEIRSSGAAGSGDTGLTTSGTTISPTVTADITGLTAANTYSIYVRTTCMATLLYSDWTSAVIFNTACESTGIPYSQDFESAVVPGLPTCTSVENAGTGNNWVTASNPGSGFTSKTLKYGYHTNAANAWFYTQGIDLEAGTSYRLTFNYGNNSTFYTESLNVSYGTSAVNTAMTDLIVDYPSITGGTANESTSDFTPSVSGTYYLGFNCYSGANLYYLFVDDILLDLTPSCASPTALNYSNVTASSATISWTASTSTPANGYEYFVSTSPTPVPDGSTEATGTTAAGVTTANLSSLPEQTTHYFWVRSHCDGTDFSEWAGYGEFTTDCGVFTPYYLEDFTTVVPNCWTGNGWLADGFANNGSTGAARVNLYSSGNEYFLNSPEFDLSTGGYELVFDIAATPWSGTSATSMGSDDYVELSYTEDGSNWTVLSTWNTGNTPSNTGDNTTIDLSTITGTNVQFAFLASDGLADDSEDYNIYIDNFIIREIPACAAPTALTYEDVTASSATISWTASTSAPANGYEYFVSTSATPVPDGLTEATGTTAAGETSAALSSLTEQTTYYFWVRSNCNGTDFSEWVGYGEFTTDCGIYTLPFIETFEDNSDSRVCWSQIQETGTIDWIYASGSTSQITSAHNGVLNARFYYASYSNAETKLVSPVIDLSTSANYALDFWHGQPAWGTDINELKVYYRIDASSSWIELEHYTEGTSTWTNRIIELPNTSGTYQIAFEGINNYGYGLVIDDVTIFEMPEINEIDINSDVADIDVCLGDDEATAIANLANQITITDTDNTEYVVDVTWAIDAYDGNTPDVYNATGTFTLPTGVAQTNPVTTLAVSATVTVNAPIDPTFVFETEYCQNDMADVLPAMSQEGVTGTWNTATIVTDADGDIDYTFTSDAGQCANNATITVTVNAPIDPTFNFETEYCQNDVADALPATSLEGFTGTWNTATILTDADGDIDYTFTSDAGQCANNATVTVTVNAPIDPTFDFETEYCQNDMADVLPATSLEGFTGTWNPATIVTDADGDIDYTFTPNAGECANAINITVTVNDPIDPTFVFGTDYCQFATADILPTTSENIIEGAWEPATISTDLPGNVDYIFTPNAGECANPATKTVSVTEVFTPTFSFATVYCLSDTPDELPATSDNDLTGTWNIPTIATDVAGSVDYIFTPDGTCDLPVTFHVIVNDPTTPAMFNFNTVYCINTTPAELPTTSNNMITGTWSPTAITTDVAGTSDYVFTPDDGQCAMIATKSVTVNNPVDPTFVFETEYCRGTTADILPLMCEEGFTGTWNPTEITTDVPGDIDYIFTPDAGECANPATVTVSTIEIYTPTFSFSTEYCQGDIPEPLPTTSDNLLTGSWSPAVINTSHDGTMNYTFTPDGMCNNPITKAITINEPVYPIFIFEGVYCVGDTPDELPTTAENGITGTWSPAIIVTSSAGNLDYTFTPDAGQCAKSITIAISVNETVNPTFGFETAYCQGATPAVLPIASLEFVTGTWSPSAISTDILGDTDYVFTPDDTDCTNSTTITVSVTEVFTPSFSFSTVYCLGDTPDGLPTTSDNGRIGTWNPMNIATDVAGTVDYTFTPDEICDNPVTFTVFVNDPTTPATFSFATDYCLNDTPDELPTTSDNMITGTWNIANIATDAPGTSDYIFTPDAGQCAISTTVSVTINDPADPTFDFETEYCLDDVADELPLISDNMISGTWNPAIIVTDADGDTDYVFTPDAGQCANNATITVTINAPANPTFDFETVYCLNAMADVLPATSLEMFTGTWNPALIVTDADGDTEYTFTSDAGQCANNATITVSVNAPIDPTFVFETEYCLNATADALPTSCEEGFTGTWNPATIVTDADGDVDYTFTPDAGECANNATVTVTVNNPIDPTFVVETEYCQNATADVLPATSENMITGTWSPATIATDVSGDTDYIFTPNDGECANETTITITVTEVFTPTFDFTTVYCLGDTPDALPAISDNDLIGIWSPTTIATDVAGTADYIFTPEGTCDLPVTIQVTVNNPIEATFDFETEYCLDGTADELPLTSENMITGTWNPGTIATDVAGTSDYVFTPDAGQCAISTTVSVTVNDPVEPTFDFETEYCLDGTADELPLTSENMITGTWNPATIATDVAGTSDYVFTPDNGECVIETTVSITINALPVVECPETMAMTSEDGVITLEGATPTGGVYSGTNVTAGEFDPTGLTVGAYTITYTYTDSETGCESSCDFIIDIITEISTVSIEGINVYPNPNNGQFTIDFNNIEGNVSYQIYDTKGSIIVSEDISANGNTVQEVSLNLVPGVYFVKIVTTSQTFVEKLVIE